MPPFFMTSNHLLSEMVQMGPRGCLRPFGQASVVAASFMKRLPSLLSQR